MIRIQGVVLVLMMAACGGDDDGGSSPVAKCDNLVDTVCDRAVDCVPSQGTHTQCVQQIQQVISCGAAKAVSATYDRCISQLQSNSCSVLFPINPQTGEPELELPADCNQVILQRTVPGVSEWSSLVGEVSTQSAE
jgi:hypothetical protein